MTQEDKQLLLKDLCARFPYGIIVHIHDINVDDYDRQLIGEDLDFIELDRRNCMPYLRQMSSMTEEERKELSQISEEYLDDWSTADSNLLKWKIDAKVSSMRAAFYNSHYLDWNDLISKGLALKAPKNMYKTE